MATKTVLINGVFFQQGFNMGIGYRPGEGAVPTVMEVERFTFFSGVINFEDENLLGEGSGSMTDYYGESVISGVVVKEDSVTFTKKYLRRDDLIHYTFNQKDEGMWVGGYDGKATGPGDANCILVPVKGAFFMPPPDPVEE